mgnify:CR=1 FL=1
MTPCSRFLIGAFIFSNALAACGTAENALAPIEGLYRTTNHLVNDSNCAVDGVAHDTQMLNGATVWHDDYFRIFRSTFTERWELEWCADQDGKECRFSLFSVEGGSEDWFYENAQAGGQSGFDCENRRETFSAFKEPEGAIRLEYRIYVKAFPEGDPQCKLSAAQSLEGNQYCAGYEVITGEPVE